MRLLYTTIFPVALGLLLFVGGCKKQDESLSGISGRVTIDGAPAAEVTVELYSEPNYDDTQVWYYTSRQRSVGFVYSPQAVFDWRRDDRFLLQQVTTDGDGKFNFPDKPDNDYVLSVRKSGFGWAVPRLVELRGSSLDAGTIELYTEMTFPRTELAENTTWEGDGRHYVLTGDLIIPAGVTLTIEPGAFVRVDEPNQLIVGGQLVATGDEDQYISFTSNFMTDPGPFDWDGVLFRYGAETPEFRYCRFDYATTAVQVPDNGGTYEHCYFGYLASQALDCNGQLLDESLHISSCVFDRVSLDARAHGMYAVDVTHNIFFAAHSYALFIEGARDGEIFCNWFQDCGRFDTTSSAPSGVILLTNAQNFEVHRCHFLQSAFALDLGSKVDSSVTIHHNTFQGINRVLNVGVTEEQLGASYPLFNFNCMVSIDKINVIVHACHINTHNIEATSNFWNTPSEENVLQFMIQDCRDDDENPSFVVITPILENCPSGVGLCTSQ